MRYIRNRTGNHVHKNRRMQKLEIENSKGPGTEPWGISLEKLQF